MDDEQERGSRLPLRDEGSRLRRMRNARITLGLNERDTGAAPTTPMGRDRPQGTAVSDAILRVGPTRNTLQILPGRGRARSLARQRGSLFGRAGAAPPAQRHERSPARVVSRYAPSAAVLVSASVPSRDVLGIECHMPRGYRALPRWPPRQARARDRMRLARWHAYRPCARLSAARADVRAPSVGWRVLDQPPGRRAVGDGRDRRPARAPCSAGAAGCALRSRIPLNSRAEPMTASQSGQRFGGMRRARSTPRPAAGA
jgi:hypothetical protein